MASARLYRKGDTPDTDFFDGLDTQFDKSLTALYGNQGTYRLPSLEEALREARFQQSDSLAKECIRQAKEFMKSHKVQNGLALEDVSVLTLFFGGADSVYFDLLNDALIQTRPSQSMRGLLVLLLVALRKLPVCTQTGPLVFYSNYEHKDYTEGKRKFWNRFVSTIEAFEASGLLLSKKCPMTFIIEGKVRCYNIGAFFDRTYEYIFEPCTIVNVKKKTDTVATTEVITERPLVLQQLISTLTQKSSTLSPHTSPHISPQSSPFSLAPHHSPSLPSGQDCTLLSKTFYASSILWNGCILSWSPVNIPAQSPPGSIVIYQVARRSNVFTSRDNAIVYEGTDTTVEHTDLEADMGYEFYLRYGIQSPDAKSGQQSVAWSKWTLPLKVKTQKLYVNTGNVAFHVKIWHTVVFDIKIPTLVSKKAPDSGKNLLRFNVIQSLRGGDEQISYTFDTNRITLKHLLPDSEYDVRVRVTRKGEEKWSGFTFFNVLTLKLQPPPGFAATAKHWHKIRLTWGTPAGCKDKPVLYRVELKKSQDEYALLYEGFSNSFSFEKLSPETEYTFRAAATLDNKQSDWIEASARTPAVPPFESSRWKECPEDIADSCRGYVIGGERGETATFLGTDCAVVPYETLLSQNRVNKWGIKVRRLPEGVTDGRGLWFGVAPYDVEQSTGWRNLEKTGWYFWCGGSGPRKSGAWSTPMLFSGPPHNYKRVPYGNGKARSFLQEGDVVLVEMDMVCGDLSFVIKGEDCASGPAYTGIPLDVPLVPVVNITRKNTSVEFIPPQ